MGEVLLDFLPRGEASNARKELAGTECSQNTRQRSHNLTVLHRKLAEPESKILAHVKGQARAVQYGCNPEGEGYHLLRSGLFSNQTTPY
jgi:hypothetical protein